jgi:hypothetical protein
VIVSKRSSMRCGYSGGVPPGSAATSAGASGYGGSLNFVFATNFASAAFEHVLADVVLQRVHHDRPLGVPDVRLVLDLHERHLLPLLPSARPRRY